MSYNTGTPTEYFSIPTMAAGDVPALDTDGLTAILNAIDSAMHGIGGGDVSSVFGRTGAVTADSGDYTDAEITNSPTNTLTTTGDLLYASAAHTLARLGIGSSGQIAAVSSGLPAWVTPAFNTVANPSAVDTASTTAVMAGLNKTITPEVSGRIKITLSGTINSWGEGIVAINYGTGTPPSSGAASTGTQLAVVSNQSNTDIPLCMSPDRSGLTLGTTYWYDIAFLNEGGNTITVADIAISAIEIP